MKKVIAVVVLLSALTLIGTAQVSAQTINGCINNKTKALRISDTCTKSETPISWNQTGPQGIQGLPGTPGGITVRSAIGEYIGVLAGFESDLKVYVPSLNTMLWPNANTGENRFRNEFYYKNSDCVGTLYVKSTVNAYANYFIWTRLPIHFTLSDQPEPDFVFRQCQVNCVNFL